MFIYYVDQFDLNEQCLAYAEPSLVCVEPVPVNVSITQIRNTAHTLLDTKVQLKDPLMFFLDDTVHVYIYSGASFNLGSFITSSNCQLTFQ